MQQCNYCQTKGEFKSITLDIRVSVFMSNFVQHLQRAVCF